MYKSGAAHLARLLLVEQNAKLREDLVCVPQRSHLNDALGDNKCTPTKHLIPPPHHSSRPAAAHTDTETPPQ